MLHCRRDSVATRRRNPRPEIRQQEADPKSTSGHRALPRRVFGDLRRGNPVRDGDKGDHCEHEPGVHVVLPRAGHGPRGGVREPAAEGERQVDQAELQHAGERHQVQVMDAV